MTSATVNEKKMNSSVALGAVVGPRLRKEITDAVAALEAANNGYAIERAEKALLIAAKPLTGLKSREADELWKLVGKARADAHQALLASRLVELTARFGSGNGHPKRDRRNGGSAKSERSIPSGTLSPFAGQPAEKWQADLERGRQRQISGGISRRGAPVPGTRKRAASSKKT